MKKNPDFSSLLKELLPKISPYMNTINEVMKDSSYSNKTYDKGSYENEQYADSSAVKNNLGKTYDIEELLKKVLDADRKQQCANCEHFKDGICRKAVADKPKICPEWQKVRMPIEILADRFKKEEDDNDIP